MRYALSQRAMEAIIRQPLRVIRDICRGKVSSENAPMHDDGRRTLSQLFIMAVATIANGTI